MHAWFSPYAYDSKVGTLYEIVTPWCDTSEEADRCMELSDSKESGLLVKFRQDQVQYDYDKCMYVKAEAQA